MEVFVIIHQLLLLGNFQSKLSCWFPNTRDFNWILTAFLGIREQRQSSVFTFVITCFSLRENLILMNLTSISTVSDNWLQVFPMLLTVFYLINWSMHNRYKWNNFVAYATQDQRIKIICVNDKVTLFPFFFQVLIWYYEATRMGDSLCHAVRLIQFLTWWFTTFITTLTKMLFNIGRVI